MINLWFVWLPSMKQFSCRLKALPVPAWASKQYLVAVRRNTALALQTAYAAGALPPPLEAAIPYRLAELQTEFPHVDFSLPWVVECGSGTGEFIIAAARRTPTKLFIGIDAARPCIERALRKLPQQTALLPNLLFYNGWALDFLTADLRGFPIAELLVNFPDPWLKKRHFKRRLVSPAFVSAAVQALAASGLLITVSDVASLHGYHQLLLSASPKLRPLRFLQVKAVQPYYEYSSRYQEKNLAAAPQLYHTAHQRAA